MKKVFLLPLIAMFSLAGCGGEAGGQSSVSLSELSKTVEVGQTFDLTATSTDESDITWTVDSNIVTLSAESSKSGAAITVTAARIGETKIIAENAAGKAAECAVTVTDKAVSLTGIVIKSQPTKTIYKIGEQLDLTGLVVEASYSNQTSKTLSADEYTVSGFNSSVANDNLALTVAYQGKTAKFTVKVMADPADLPNVAVLYGIFNGAEADVPNHKGEVVYWYGDGGNISNVSPIENGVRVTFTNAAEPNPSWGWYGCQLFYGLPYVHNGDTINLSLKLKASGNGPITINHEEYNLDAGQVQEIKMEGFKVTGTNESVISLQLGIPSPASCLESGTIDLYDVVVKDLTNSYHLVKFNYEGSTLYEEQVADNQVVFKTPNHPAAPAGKTFVGWVDETGKYLSKKYVITKDTVFTAKYLDDSEIVYHDVVIYDGDSIYASYKVMEGQLFDTTLIKAPFAKKVFHLYDDDAMSHEFDSDNPILNETHLYVTFATTYETTFHKDAGTIDPNSFSNESDGSLHLTGLQPYGNDGVAWWIQINFTLPADGNYHMVSFDYKINLAGGNVQVWNNSTQQTLSSKAMLVKTDYQNTYLTYNAAAGQSVKLSIELGLIRATSTIETIDLLLNNFTLSEVN